MIRVIYESSALTSARDARNVNRDTFFVRSQNVVRYVIAFFVQHAQTFRRHCKTFKLYYYLISSSIQNHYGVDRQL